MSGYRRLTESTTTAATADTDGFNFSAAKSIKTLLTSSSTSSGDSTLSRLHTGSLLFVGFVWSVLIGAGVRCRSPLSTNVQLGLPLDYGDRQEMHWLACSHGIVVFLFVPLWSGLIDLFKVNYRLCSAAVGLLALISCVLSADLQDPGHLVLTDAIMSGTASSIALATLILLIDDHFPEDSKFRVLATTCVQVNSVATFYLVAQFADWLPSVGWRGAFYWLGGCQCAVALTGMALFSRRPGRRWQTRRQSIGDGDYRGGVVEDDASVIDKIRERGNWSNRLLSLSQSDFDQSRTVLLWLLERLTAALISDGLFLYLLMQSGLISLAGNYNAAIEQKHQLDDSRNVTSTVDLTTALAFSAGSSSAFIAGGLLGGLLARGRMLTVYMVGSLTVLCSLIGWLGVANDPADIQWPFSLACGVGVGAFNTFAYAASEEATGVRARFMFPFTRLSNGVAMAMLEVVRAGLINSSNGHVGGGGDILLALLLLLSMAQISIQLLVKRKSQRGLKKIRPGKLMKLSQVDDDNDDDRIQMLLLRPTRRKKQSLAAELQ